MSDNPIDLSEWLLSPAEQTPHEQEHYQLPPNISDYTIWNTLPLIDINLTPDHNSHLDNIPKNETHQLSTSPITTRVDGLPTTPETFPDSTPSTHRPPLAQIPANPLRLTATHNHPNTTPITKPINKNLKVAHVPLDSRRYPSSLRLSKQKSRTKQTPNRLPTRRAKLEIPLLSPSLAAKHLPPKSSTDSKRPHDQSRQRHNQMMRENRHRFNNKFKELTDLLDSFKDPACEYKPMKNKIQILERAIYQYAQMQTKRARYESELLFSPEHSEDVNNDFLKVFITVPSLPDACNLVIQNMCATMNWKYGDAWIRSTSPQSLVQPPSDQYQLCTSFVAKNNMPDTRTLLEHFSKHSKANRMDPYLLTLSQHRHSVWIPNLSAKADKSSRAAAAKKAGITTMFTVPVYLGEDSSGLPDAIISLMHVNDELLSYGRQERPYDSQSMTRLLDLVAAVVKSRAKIAC